MRRKKNAFTLIELIAVLVILAIIALIVTPLVMNIVKKAKDSANKRSVDAYGKAVELAVAAHLLDKGEYPEDLTTISLEYSGKDVACNVMTLNTDGSVYLSECSVGTTEVKDDSTEDGWYHYGKNELSDSSDSNPSTDEDIVTYNGMEFYTISSDEDSVTLLKAEPLTVDEVNTYGGVGTDNNHVNMYVTSTTTDSYYQTASDNNGYGGMAYYSSSTCGFDADGNYLTEGCTTDYAQSEVKYVVDAWTNDKLNASDLTEDSLGYKTRLLTFEDLTNNLGYAREEGSSSMSFTENTPSWVYNSNYRYWTMSPYDNSASSVWYVDTYGFVLYSDVYYGGNVVRPVITLLKSSI